MKWKIHPIADSDVLCHAGERSCSPALENTIMAGKPGPLQIVDIPSGAAYAPIAAPPRHYACQHYMTCLELAAALNWRSFTCEGCSQQVDQTLVWRACQEKRKDKVAGRICPSNQVTAIETQADPRKRTTRARADTAVPALKIAAKH